MQGKGFRPEVQIAPLRLILIVIMLLLGLSIHEYKSLGVDHFLNEILLGSLQIEKVNKAVEGFLRKIQSPKEKPAIFLLSVA